MRTTLVLIVLASAIASGPFARADGLIGQGECPDDDNDGVCAGKDCNDESARCTFECTEYPQCADACTGRTPDYDDFLTDSRLIINGEFNNGSCEAEDFPVCAVGAAQLTYLIELPSPESRVRCIGGASAFVTGDCQRACLSYASQGVLSLGPAENRFGETTVLLVAHYGSFGPGCVGDPEPFAIRCFLDDETCGDGFADPGEDCDTSDQSATCDEDCTFPMCGDGLTNALFGEECDDDNNIDDDDCSNQCTLNRCGNGRVDSGEECDDFARGDSDLVAVGMEMDFFGDEVPSVEIRLNVGGAFELQTQILTEWSSIAVGDLDADGDPDVLLPPTGWLENQLTRFTLVPFDLPSWTDSEVVDLDNDGDHDVVGWMNGSCDLFVWHNDGKGVLTSAQTIPVCVNDAAIADLDGNSLPDIVIATDDQNVTWNNQGGGTFAASGAVLGSGGVRVVANGFDALAGVDIVIVDGGATLRVWHNNGSGGFSPGWSGSLPSPLGTRVHLLAGDLNGNGFIDLYSETGPEFGMADYSTWLNNGLATFELGVQGTEYTASDAAMDDYDADLDLDILRASDRILKNDGAGALSPAEFLRGQRIVLADLDGDGEVHSDDGCDVFCREEVCGDGIANDGESEECDGDDFRGYSCAELGQVGQLACDDTCNLDSSGCVIADVCGNGLVESPETCDPPGQPAGEPDECRDDCTFCGDGIIDQDPIKGTVANSEACDDGNNVGGDGCSANCTVEECGQPLTHLVISDKQVLECTSIVTGNPFRVSSTGDLTLVVTERVTLGNGLTVDEGARVGVVLNNDPAPASDKQASRSMTHKGPKRGRKNDGQ